MPETVTKVVQGVDRLFDEIVVNGRTVKSTPQIHTQNTNPSPAVTEPVEGQYVGAVQLNNTIHGLKDVPLNQRVSDIESLIPSEASSSNKLVDKGYVDTEVSDAIDNLDVSEVGGNGKYIKSISQVNGKIVAVEGFLSGSGVAFVGTRAQYETAKLIPIGETGHIPSGALVIITDETDYLNSEDR